MTTDTDDFRPLGPSADLPDNWVLPYYLSDEKRRVAVARVGSDLYAFDDMYQSLNGPCPLSSGLLEGTVIMSQCDGTRFDLTTGAVVDGPGTTPLTMHTAREADSQIMINLGE